MKNPALLALACLTGFASFSMVSHAVDDPYDRWEVEVDGGGRIEAQTRGDRLVRLLWLREDGMFTAYGNPAAHLQVPDHHRADNVRATADSLVGEFKVADIGVGKKPSPERPLARLTAKIDWKADAKGAVTGTVTVDGKAASVKGQRIPEPAMSAAQAVSKEAVWPLYHGPRGDFTAPDPEGRPLRADISALRPVWASEDILPAPSAGPRFTAVPAGGGAGLALADGRIFARYFVPAGTVRWPEAAAQTRDGIPEPWNLHLADDVVVCLDAATGKLLWRHVGALEGMTWPTHKQDMQGQTPAVAGGRVFAAGSGGWITALDAATGKLLWRTLSPIDGQALQASAQRRASGAHSNKDIPTNRSEGHNPVATEDVLVIGGIAGGRTRGDVAGLDAATGAVLWTRKGIQEYTASPLVWRGGGGALVIVTGAVPSKDNPKASIGIVRALDPKTGEDVWTIEGLGPMKTGTVLRDDLLFANTGTDAGPGSRLAAFQISATGAKKLWEAPEGTGGVWDYAPGSGTMVVGGNVWTRGLDGKSQTRIVLDPKDGRVISREAFAQNVNETSGIGGDSFALWHPEYQHGKIEAACWLTPGAGEPVWFRPQIPPGTGYQLPFSAVAADGRLYFRGMDGIYAFDLRGK